MAYRVVYHPELEETLPVGTSHSVHREMLMLAGTVILILIILFGWSRDSFRKLQGLAEVYDLNIFIERLREGEKFTQAFTDFCLEVMRYGSLQ